MTQLEALAKPSDKGLRLDRFLSQSSDQLSRSRAKSLIKAGQVQAVSEQETRIEADPRHAVIPGMLYILDMPDAVPATPEPENLPVEILYEDEHLLLVNKAAGMAVHPAPGSWQGTLVNALLHHCQGKLPGIGGVERPGIVHRIDKQTTGVLVVAKTERAHQGLSELFAKHDIERTYLALTRGAPRPLSGSVQTDIARSAHDRKKMAVVSDGLGRLAITHYKALKTFGMLSKADPSPAAALISCQLETGRTHQIRVHMASLGSPLIGDPVYGRHRGIKAWGRGDDFDLAVQAARKLTRQALHASSLGFKHPVTGQTVSVCAPLPEDMAGLVQKLENL